VKLIDVRCEPVKDGQKVCGKVLKDVFEDDTAGKPCECGGIFKRMYAMRKFKEFVPKLYENFGDEPIYIESREQFRQECEKRNLYQRGGDGCYDIRVGKKKHTTDTIVPVVKKKSRPDPDKMAEKAVAEAIKQVGSSLHD